jgi:hypothetical protein
LPSRIQKRIRKITKPTLGAVYSDNGRLSIKLLKPRRHGQSFVEILLGICALWAALFCIKTSADKNIKLYTLIRESWF